MNRPSRSDKGADMTRDRRVRMLTQTKGQTDMNFKKTLLAAALTLSAGFAMAADLPQVAILATGGTIAGTAASATQTTGYKAGDLAIQTLIDAVPQIKDYATVTGEQIVKISSNNLTDQVLLTLARRCNELLADPKVSGIVITHGTDTLDFTANYFGRVFGDLPVPLVLISALYPLSDPRSNGFVNFAGAMTFIRDCGIGGAFVSNANPGKVCRIYLAERLLPADADGVFRGYGGAIGRISDGRYVHDEKAFPIAELKARASRPTRRSVPRHTRHTGPRAHGLFRL